MTFQYEPPLFISLDIGLVYPFLGRSKQHLSHRRFSTVRAEGQFTPMSTSFGTVPMLQEAFGRQIGRAVYSMVTSQSESYVVTECVSEKVHDRQNGQNRWALHPFVTARS